MTNPPVPASIAQALLRHPEPLRGPLLEVRDLIFAVAAETDTIGPLTETLKWGEPAYLTEASRSGSTIRLGSTRTAPRSPAVFFNCKTTLIEIFRTQFANEFGYEGNRALVVPPGRALPRDPLRFCLHMALTWHRRKAAGERL